LSKDKEALKNSMLDVIRKKPKQTVATGTLSKNAVMPRESGIGATAMNTNTGIGQMQGFSNQPAGGLAGANAGTMMGMQ
jgi:hypothetical protein